MGGCNHFWVSRTDGYEEQCAPAICLLCGEYSCTCELSREIQSMPELYKQRRMELFNSLGIAGDDHKLEGELMRLHSKHAKKTIATWPKWKQEINCSPIGRRVK